MNRRDAKRSLDTVNGFTLIELVLAMSIFSLILLMAYQVLASSARAKLSVSDSVGKQAELRSAYRTLSNAFDSGAQIKGDRHNIELDLTTADSPWLEDAKRISFVLSVDHILSAVVDDQDYESILLDALEQAEFRFFDGELRHSNWSSIQRPSAIELSWNHGGELRRWRFDTR